MCTGGRDVVKTSSRACVRVFRTKHHYSRSTACGVEAHRQEPDMVARIHAKRYNEQQLPLTKNNYLLSCTRYIRITFSTAPPLSGVNGNTHVENNIRGTSLHAHPLPTVSKPRPWSKCLNSAVTWDRLRRAPALLRAAPNSARVRRPSPAKNKHTANRLHQIKNLRAAPNSTRVRRPSPAKTSSQQIDHILI